MGLSGVTGAGTAMILAPSATTGGGAGQEGMTMGRSDGRSSASASRRLSVLSCRRVECRPRLDAMTRSRCWYRPAPSSSSSSLKSTNFVTAQIHAARWIRLRAWRLGRETFAD